MIIVPKPTTRHFLNEARIIGINARSTLPMAAAYAMSTEAIQVNFVHQKLVGSLKALWDNTSGFIARLFSNAPESIAPSIDITQAINIANRSYYLEDKEIQVFVPEGLSCSLVEYLSVLEQMTLAAEDFYFNGLIPFKVWLSAVNNDPTKLNSITGHTGVKAIDPTDLLKSHNACFKGKVSRVKYKKAFQHNSDWATLEERTNKMLANLSDKLRPDIVGTTVGDIDMLLGELINGLNDPQKNYMASPKNIEALAMLCHNTARMVEFYGVLCYSVRSFVVAINDSSKEYLKHRR